MRKEWLGPNGYSRYENLRSTRVHSRGSEHRKGKSITHSPMRPTATSLAIPQPCHESWDAMSPATTGRHCAACAKTVVDFTLKTDAEILAYLAGAANDRTCGRFAAGQLERPLQRAAPVAPAARWRAWLAAAVAVWALREGTGTAANAQAATEWRARCGSGPTPAAGNTQPVSEAAPLAWPKLLNTVVLPSTLPATIITMGIVSSQRSASVAPLAPQPLVLHGVITDAADGQGLPSVTVLIKGTAIGVSTAADGSYVLPVPAALAGAPVLTISVSSVGFMTQDRTLPARMAREAQAIRLQADNRILGEVVLLPPHKLPPAPWHPRAFYSWGKYWLTRPFHRR
jgi:hypothetical protein